MKMSCKLMGMRFAFVGTAKYEVGSEVMPVNGMSREQYGNLEKKRFLRKVISDTKAVRREQMWSV